MFAFTKRDLADYSRLLRSALPTIRIFEEPTVRERSSKNTSAPALRFRESLADCEGGYAQFVLDPAWEPVWRPPHDRSDWILVPIPWPDGEVETGRIRDDEKNRPPYISDGRIYFRCEKGNKEHAALARKALRLIEKIADSGCENLRYPSYEIVWRLEKGHNIWIGRDAARWAREDPRRLLAYDSNLRMGLRPLD
jgi:hypothetical protein